MRFALRYNRDYYEKIKLHMSELFPEIKFQLIFRDVNLEKLGFVESAPCLFCFDATLDKYERMMDILMNIEIDAADVPEGNPIYKKYKRYGWLWDVLNGAEFIE